MSRSVALPIRSPSAGMTTAFCSRQPRGSCAWPRAVVHPKRSLRLAPVNKPTVTERDTCAPWLAAEYALVAESVRVVVCLGGFAWQAMWPVLRSAGFELPRPRPAFGHGAEARLGHAAYGTGARPGPAGHHAPDRELMLVGCYHPSQQNTFTGRVTPAMLDAIFRRASALARQA